MMLALCYSVAQSRKSKVKLCLNYTFFFIIINRNYKPPAQTEQKGEVCTGG